MLYGERGTRRDLSWRWRRIQSVRTRADDDGHGALLNDGADLGEGGEAAVVPSAVLLLDVREVEVAVQAHGDAVVLLDVLQV